MTPWSRTRPSGRPVAEDDARVAALALRVREPGRSGEGGGGGSPFMVKSTRPSAVHTRKACQHVDGEAQSLHAGKLLIPAVRLIAINI